MSTKAELLAELEKITAAEYQAKKLEEKQRLDAWRTMIANPESHEWSVVLKEFVPFMAPEGTSPIPCVIVQKRLKPEVIAQFSAVYGSHPVDEQMTRWHGMRYHRTAENILHHDSGGWCVLNDPMLCSDDEWNQIVAGNIPDKYKKVKG